ncbi:MAG TPA: hypothetical protein VN851_19225 [Thermoanaerobaculia bacterium]|nr:hypothetical protein [Thermoanaerobaculia bacterium]
MPNLPTPKEDDLRAVLERELEQRRGRAPEAGEIFVLSETAELPVEWALLEARPKAFLAIPADTQPLAGTRDLALGANVLSGPLVLRCGHPTEIAASRLRPELRTGLLDPHSLAAARALQAALASGTAVEDLMGEEVDRDPEYRDWVEEVLDPARAVLVGLGGVSAEEDNVIPFEQGRARRIERSGRGQGSTFLRVLPWLAAACLAIALGWSRLELRKVLDAALAPQFDEPSHFLAAGTVRGESEFRVPPDTGQIGQRVRFSGQVSGDLREPMPMTIVLLDKNDREVARSPLQTRGLGEDWAMTVARSLVRQGPYRIELQSPAKKTIFFWNINVIEAPPAP